MATHDYNIGNGSGLDVRTDLNAVLSAILSQNSSATEPTVTMAGMLWYDTANSLLKQRNNSNDGWETKWDTTKGQLATLASPTFTGNVALPLTTLLNGKSIAITDAPTFTGTASFANITASGTISLPATTSIGAVSATELSYLDGVTSAIQTQLNAKQATLVSGTSIKTINGTTLLGSGNIVIQADSLSTIFANSLTFNSSGTFVVPAGVSRVLVEGCGGGGAGGSCSGTTGQAGGGGGADSPPVVIPVTAGANVSVIIGSGGAGNADPGTGGAGGNSAFGNFVFGGGCGGTGISNSVGSGGKSAGAGGTGGTGSAASASSNSNQFGGASSLVGPITVPLNVLSAGCGGSGRYGGGAIAPYTNRANGNAGGANTGAGGSGGLAINDSAIRVGGAGGSGKVIVYW